jgi:hypothetical protein
MTIQRQYRLPNCTLALSGISNAETPVGSSEARPVMSVLLNAECHLLGQLQPLTGGREFLNDLTMAVNAYAQEFLSGVHAPQAHSGGRVQLERIDLNSHCLRMRESETAEPVETILSTVQFCDLVEAVDQFLVDTQTLPDLSLQLTPTPRRYARREQPIAQHIVPATIGISGLMLAAIACLSLPIPEVQRPKGLEPRATDAQTQQAATPKPTVTPPQPNLITDPAKLEALRQELLAQLDSTWKTEINADGEPLVYRVNVNEAGKITGYEHVNDVALKHVEQTPLSALVEKATTGGTITPGAIAPFRVEFRTVDNTLHVEPWQPAFQSPPQSTPLSTPLSTP